MSAFLRSILPILGLALALALSACDSSGDAVTPGDVAGEYVFSDFRFIPESTLLPAANLLDTLVAENTRLQLSAAGGSRSSTSSAARTRSSSAAIST